MEVRAMVREVRVSPQKARMVIDVIRGKPLRDALAVLRVLPQKTAPIALKLLRSAAANAEHNYDLDPDRLYVKRIYVDEGPRYKRWQPHARGRVGRKWRRTSHITVILDELPEKGAPRG
jgi:large subunit ribosomal protein L22